MCILIWAFHYSILEDDIVRDMLDNVSGVSRLISACGMLLFTVGFIQTVMLEVIQELFFIYSGVLFMVAFILALCGYMFQRKRERAIVEIGKNIVPYLMKQYEAGKITMLEAIAKSGLTTRQFMYVLKDLGIQPKFNITGLEERM